MKTTCIKIGSLLILLFLLVACVSKREHKKVREELKNCDGPFSITSGNFKMNGYFEATINIPQTTTIGSTILKPSLVYRDDFSFRGNYIVFNLFQHGGTDKDTIDESLNQEVFSGNLKLIKPSININKAKKVYIVNLHDENYQDWSGKLKRQFRRAVRQCVKNSERKGESFCTCLNKKVERDHTVLDQPRTVGGGVIPPR